MTTATDNAAELAFAQMDEDGEPTCCPMFWHHKPEVHAAAGCKGY